MDGIGQLASSGEVAAVKSMDLFDSHTSQKLYSLPRYQSFKPIHAISDSGPFILEIFSPRELILLRSLRITILFKVVKDDGTEAGC